MSIIHIFFIKIIFIFSFSIISHLLPPNPSFFFLIHNTLLSLSILGLFFFSFFLSFFFCFVFVFFLFLRIFFFPLLLLQFEFYAFIIDDDFGLGLIKGSDFGQRKQKFLVEKMVILASSLASSSSPSSFFNFGLIIYMNLYMGLMNFYMGLMNMGVLLIF